MRVLVACEFSGKVRDAFIKKGHEALSCDLLPTESPGPHYQGDIRDILDSSWNMLIGFPPCTYLSYAGKAWWNRPGRAEKREEAIAFVNLLMTAPIEKICIENPRGHIQEAIRKSDQIIHPWWFGHRETKQTHLWLKNLPPLMATCVCPLQERSINTFVQHARGGKNKSHNRSVTFDGIALAMAEQWG